MNFEYVLVYGNSCDNFNTGLKVTTGLQKFYNNLIHKGNNSITVKDVCLYTKKFNIYGLLFIKHEA